MIFGFGRIEFDGNFINLNRPWSDFQPRRPVNSASVQAASGLEQTEFLFAQWFINARLNLLDPQEKAQLQRLFEYAEDGSSFTLIRDRNLGAYINFEGGINPTAVPRALKTNDDIDGTFTRTDVADSAWYLDEGTGLMTLRDGEDVPRFPAGKYGAGIQIDGAAQNLIETPSGPLDAGNWATGSATVTADTTETLDPAGTNTADKILTTAGGGGVLYVSGTAVGNTITLALWLKCQTGAVAGILRITGTGSGTDSKAITITTTWQRFEFTKDTSGYAGNLGLSIAITPDATVVYLWSAGLYDSFQFDPGTIGALSTSSITRNAELLLFPTANVFDSKKFTVSFWHNPRGDAGGSKLLFDVQGASGRMAHLERANSAAFSLSALDGANNTNVIQAANNSLNVDSWDNHIVVTVDSTISNGLKIYYNASLLATDVNDAFDLKEPGTNFSIGSGSGGGFEAFGAFDDFLVLNTVLTANEINGLFDLGIGLGVPRNRWTVQLNDQVWNPRWLHSDVYDIPLLLKEVLT
jgi:hypothetical protein